VLPFANLSGDADQDYLADGVVEDIITGLSRFRSFAVIARNSSFVYKGRAVDVRQVAEDLGVRYVLEGSVRRAGDRLRISAQLIDGSSGAHLWAQNFDGAFEDVFEVQDRITESVVGLVAPKIELAEIGRSRRKRPENLTAYDLYLRALQKSHTAQPEDNKEALAFLMRAIAIEPNYAVALASAAKALKHRASMGWPQFTADDRTLCLDLARRALPDADGDATVLAQCGLILVSVGRDYDRGMLVVRQAVDANPNNLTALICAGVCNIHCGSFADALAFSHRAILLSPGDPTQHWPLTAVAHAHMALGNFAEALQWAERSLAVNPRYDPTHWMLISANAQLGRLDHARRLLALFDAMAPGVTVASIEAGQAAKESARLRPILDGLRLAGMPEA
jgi:TolB-like protein/Tfp pilus assembly protein PilF